VYLVGKSGRTKHWIFFGAHLDRMKTMNDSMQRIPSAGSTRLTIEITSANVSVRWVDDRDFVAVTGGEVTVDHAGDEIFIRSDFSGISVSEDDIEIRFAGFDSPGQAVEEILARTGVLSSLGFGSSKSSRRSPLIIEVPASIAVTSVELELGNLDLRDPRGRVECGIKRGDFTSSGGTANLDVTAGTGEVRVDQLSGELIVAGGSGDISLTDIDAITNVKAGSGEVSLTRVRGDAIKIMAGSGDIDVRHSRASAYSSDCGSGDVTIEGGRLERIAVRTGSGEVECSASFGPYTQSFMTGSGTISLGIPRDISARIEAFTSGGDIDTELPLVSVGQRGPRSRRSRRQVGSVGSGEPRADVSLRTSSGDIRIHWLQTVAAEPIPMPPPVPAAPEPPAPPVPPAAPSIPGTSAEEGNRQESGASSDSQWQAVLESLQNGEISVEEADALLQSLQSRRSPD
jgi:hypothetical protein